MGWSNTVPTISGVKRCSRCSQLKSVSKFSINRRSVDSLQSWCKECQTKHHHRSGKVNQDQSPSTKARKALRSTMKFGIERGHSEESVLDLISELTKLDKRNIRVHLRRKTRMYTRTAETLLAACELVRESLLNEPPLLRQKVRSSRVVVRESPSQQQQTRWYQEWISLIFWGSGFLAGYFLSWFFTKLGG